MKRREFLQLTGLAAGAVAFPFAGGAAAETLEETFLVGDVFTVAGRYALNPVTQQTTTHLQMFIVTAVLPDRVEFYPRGQLGTHHRKSRLGTSTAPVQNPRNG